MKKIPIRLRCGLCNKCVIGSWENHVKSKDHIFHLELLLEATREYREKYGLDYCDLRECVKKVRKEMAKEEKTIFV